MDLAATIIEDSIVDCTTPGAIKYWTDEARKTFGFNFLCPCGCGKLGGVRFSPNGWSWNCNREKPTVQPSIDLRETNGPSHWHGFLVDGIWKRC